MAKERPNEIVNFITPGAWILVQGRGHKKPYSENNYFFKYILIYSQELIRQIKHEVMMTKERPTKIVNVMTPGVGFLMLGRYNISH